MLQHPFAPGSRVQWLRDDRIQSGTVAARLVGHFRPDVAPVNTFIIQIDGGGLELFPAHALSPQAQVSLPRREAQLPVRLQDAAQPPERFARRDAGGPCIMLRLTPEH